MEESVVGWMQEVEVRVVPANLQKQEEGGQEALGVGWTGML
jgi:hypothetical protein